MKLGKRQQRMIYLFLLGMGIMYYAKNLLLTMKDKILIGFLLGLAFVCFVGVFYSFLELIYYNFKNRLKKEVK